MNQNRINRFAVSLFFLVNGFIFANWAARLPSFMSDYAIDNRFIGFLLLAHSFGAFIGMPVTGGLINKFSSFKVTILSGLLFPLFYIMLPFSLNASFLLIPFFLMGFSTGIMDVAMNAQAVIVEERIKKPIMTMFHALFSIGMIIGGGVGSLMTKFDVAIQHHFLGTGLIALLLLFLTGRYLVDDQKITTTEDEAPFFVLPKGPIVLLGLIAFCCMMGEGAMSDWSTNYLKHEMGANQGVEAFGLIAFAGMMTIGRLFGDATRAKVGNYKLLVSGGVIALFGMLFILTEWHIVSVIGGFGLVGLGLSNIVPVVYSMAGSFPNIAPGVGIAMATTIGYMGFMIGPPIIGFIADLSSLRIGLAVTAVLFIVMIALIGRFRLINKN